jgi:DNA-binding XRE family transcriptional regulator
MSKSSHSLSALPSQTTAPLERLGLRLRAHRVNRAWTIAEMAERLLCSPNTLRALESGEIDSLDGVALAPAGLAAKRRVRRSAAQGAAGVIAEGERDF